MSAINPESANQLSSFSLQEEETESLINAISSDSKIKKIFCEFENNVLNSSDEITCTVTVGYEGDTTKKIELHLRYDYLFQDLLPDNEKNQESRSILNKAVLDARIKLFQEELNLILKESSKEKTE